MIMSIINLVLSATLSQVVVNEVMANPKGPESGTGSPGDRNEFIELYNPTDDTIDLANWIVSDGAEDDFITLWTDAKLLVKYPSVRIRSTKMAPHSFALIFDPEYTSSDTVGGYVQPYELPESTLVLTVKNTTIGNGLSNKDPVVLKDKLTNRISTFGTPDSDDNFPADAGDGKSWERISPLAADSKGNWRVSSDGSGSTPGRANSTGIDEKKSLRTRFGLLTPVPNPWCGRTKIGFFLPAAGEIRLALFALDGRRVERIASGVQSAGYHEIDLVRSGLAAGSYFFVLETQAGRTSVQTTICR